MHELASVVRPLPIPAALLLAEFTAAPPALWLPKRQAPPRMHHTPSEGPADTRAYTRGCRALGPLIVRRWTAAPPRRICGTARSTYPLQKSYKCTHTRAALPRGRRWQRYMAAAAPAPTSAAALNKSDDPLQPRRHSRAGRRLHTAGSATTLATHGTRLHDLSVSHTVPGTPPFGVHRTTAR